MPSSSRCHAGIGPPRIDYPPTEVFRFAAEKIELGLSSVEAAPGEVVRIYDAEGQSST